MATNSMPQTVTREPSKQVSHQTSPPVLDPANDPFNFVKNWKISTSRYRVSRYGFRRFRTSQLLSIRFLEDEIATLDAEIYQAGLKLSTDMFGLINAEGQAGANEAVNIMTETKVQKLRGLFKEYNEALLNFNAVMLMEKSSLADSDLLSSQQSDLGLHEVFSTCLVRVDRAPRSFKDPLRGWLHERLRALRFDRPKQETSQQEPEPNGNINTVEAKRRKHYRDSSRLTDMSARLLVAFLAAIFFVVPLVILNFQESTKAHLLTVSLCIIIFSLVLSLGTKASNQETMVACGGYAAVLVVFVSSSNNNSPVS